MKATGKADFDEENADKLLNGEWTMFRLDSLEDRIVSLNKNMFNKDLTEKAINQVPELKEIVDFDVHGLEDRHKPVSPSE